MIVTLENAKLNLGVTDPAQDDEVQMFADFATAQVLDFLGTRADPAWDETTSPLLVQAAVLQVLTNNFEHRGDEEDEDYQAKNAAIMSRLLMNLRDIGLA